MRSDQFPVDVSKCPPLLQPPVCLCVHWSYRDAPPLIGRLGCEESLVSVGSLHSQETVGGVSDAAGQHAVSEHGVDHRTLPVTGPEHTDVT